MIITAIAGLGARPTSRARQRATPLATRIRRALAADKNGVDTNGVAAEVVDFDRLGKKARKHLTDLTDFDRLC